MIKKAPANLADIAFLLNGGILLAYAAWLDFMLQIAT